MILLLGGTGESAHVAKAIAGAGYRVLLSAATDVPLETGSHANLFLRRGRLDREGMAALVRQEHIRAIVDVTHPYASQVRATAAQVAEHLRIPYLTYVRPGGVSSRDGVLHVATHHEAAQVAFSFGLPVLLTTGSKNLALYIDQARASNLPLIARVLSHPDSVQACLDAGLPEDCIVTGRGPFTVEENRRLLRTFGIGVLVTKDSGVRGGIREKLEAALQENCSVIVVDRPELPSSSACATLPELISGLKACVPAAPTVVTFDLESVLVPEIWETVAQVTGVPELALTTRDIPDYDVLMRERLRLCRKHALTLARLREIVATMEPLPGTFDFLAALQKRMLVVVVSDTYHELAGPVFEKLGCPLMICNGLTIDEQGYVNGYRPHHLGSKAGAVAHFQGLGFQVIAVGDSFNDLSMLRTANHGILYCPCSGVRKSAGELPVAWSLPDLRTELQTCLTKIATMTDN
jgi:precorrin-6A/cobalt-precorrin-6A reductase